jgi:hypothetical protein
MKKHTFSLYTKSKKQKIDILSMLDNNIKLSINFNLVKNGANPYEVFNANPVGLDSFLTGKSVDKVKAANEEKFRKEAKENYGYFA